MEQLAGKVAVITGGASGIGFATAKALAAKGVKLVLADIEPRALEKAAAELATAGTRVESAVCDVSKLRDVEGLAATAFRQMGGVHIVFNNAGVAVGGPIVAMKHSDWEWTMQVNLWGPIHGVEAFLPRMIDQKQGGHLLFTSSFAGLVPNEGLGPYCVSKYGVVALAEVLHRELREQNIGVSVLCPMRVATNIGQSERNRPAELGGPGASPVVQDQDESNANLAGRVLNVDDVARMVVDAIVANRLYILPHEESRKSIRRRFERIDRTFDEQEKR
jgi:NAD(P)-dependent dehydrogenase (short-subunit alcohol dehydrogenase family)